MDPTLKRQRTLAKYLKTEWSSTEYNLRTKQRRIFFNALPATGMKNKGSKIMFNNRTYHRRWFHLKVFEGIKDRRQGDRRHGTSH